MAKYFMPALALVSTVLAQTPTICSGPSITIASDADASQIVNCQTYDGDVIISSSAVGTINLNGVQKISGDLQCRNATALTTINAPALTEIDGTFDLEGLITLSTLNMGFLQRVNQIYWQALPALQGLSFSTGIRESNRVYISNTQLNDLQGIELTQVGTIDVNNNFYLNDINVNGLTNITDYLSFSANGMNLNVNFPNLESAGNLTFRNVSSVSVPSLSSVGGSIGMYSDYFQNFSAPNLSTIGASLAFIDCSQLQTFSFPQLTFIGGGFIVVNNTNLKAIDGVTSLQTVAGAIDWIGTFDSVSTPALRDVRGGANVVTSSQNSSICTVISNEASRQIIKGSQKCSVNTVTSQTNGSSGGSSGTKNAAAALSVAPVVPFTGLLGFVAYMLL